MEPVIYSIDDTNLPISEWNEIQGAYDTHGMLGELSSVGESYLGGRPPPSRCSRPVRSLNTEI